MDFGQFPRPPIHLITHSFSIAHTCTHRHTHAEPRTSGPPVNDNPASVLYFITRGTWAPHAFLMGVICTGPVSVSVTLCQRHCLSPYLLPPPPPVPAIALPRMPKPKALVQEITRRYCLLSRTAITGEKKKKRERQTMKRHPLCALRCNRPPVHTALPVNYESF